SEVTRSGYAGDAGVDEVGAGDVNLEVRDVPGTGVDAEVHLVGLADGQVGDHRAQRGTGAALDEGHFGAVGNGAVVGEGIGNAARDGIESGAVRVGSGPAHDVRVARDVAGVVGERVDLETGLEMVCAEASAKVPSKPKVVRTRVF